jgi:phosphatidylserine decarboxylase
MSLRPSVLSQVLALVFPVHPDGYKFIVPAAIATVVFFLVSTSLGVLGAAVTVALAFFFRDPHRVIPMRDGLAVSPADGLVVETGLRAPPAELGFGSETRPFVSIYLSLLNVHVARAPVPGTLLRSVHTPGSFGNAAGGSASSDNERHGLVLAGSDGAETACVLIAGLLARRIVVSVAQGDRIEIGERVGLIRFGSRVDVYLPADATIVVAEGQTVVAGESLIADLTGAISIPQWKRR